MKINIENLGKVINTFFSNNSEIHDSGTWTKNELKKEDLDDLFFFYKNSFRRGLIESPEKYPHKKPYSDNKFNLKFFIKYYLKIKLNQRYIKNMLQVEKAVFQDTGIRFPFHSMHKDFYYTFDNTSFNSNLRKYASFLLFMQTCLDFRKVKNVCEIGAGYGGMAELMIFNHSENISNYIIIDLFETMSISMTYLTNSVSGYNFYYIEEADSINEIDFSQKNIVFIPTNVYSQIKSTFRNYLHIDLFINTNSFVEMPKDIVVDYFRFIEQFSDTYLFSSNAIKRIEQGYEHGAYKLPYDNNWTHVKETIVSKYNDLTRLSKR
jgi:hypothetical protein